MGHVVFVLLHLAALLWMWLALFLTVPLHLVFAVLARRSRAKPTPEWLTRQCPECREEVRRDALRCKHCGAALTPEDVVQLVRQQAQLQLRAQLVTAAIVAAVVMLLWKFWRP